MSETQPDSDLFRFEDVAPVATGRLRSWFEGLHQRIDLVQVLWWAAPLCVLVWGAWVHRWVAEDAYITFRSLDQLFAGNGPVFNRGFRVEVSTSPLWFYLVALLRLLFGWAIDQAWLTVIAGMVFGVASLGFAQWGAVVLARARGHRGRLYPAGVLVPACLAPFWEYTTSGLENSLANAWVAGCFAALALRVAPQAGRSGASKGSSSAPSGWLAFLIGLGVLIRAEMVTLVVAYLVAMWATTSPGWRYRARSLAQALALPVAYEVFRMGYYGALVPNAALAKEGLGARWDTGFGYLVDMAQPYWLAVPIAALVLLGFGWGRGGWTRPVRMVALAPVVGGVLYVLIVVRYGGDYIHGRLLVTPVFCLTLPFAVAAPRWITARISSSDKLGRRPGAGVALAVLAVWGAIATVGLRVQYTEEGLVGHDRALWEALARGPNPITLADYGAMRPLPTEFANRADTGEDTWITVTLGMAEYPLPQGGMWVYYNAMGLFPTFAGNKVSFVDVEALVDPLGSRMELPEERTGKPGHEKVLNSALAYAEVIWATDPGTKTTSVPVDPVAYELVSCGEVADLIEGVSAPLTPALFASNVRNSLSFTRMRIPNDLNVAVEQYCD